MCYEVHLHVQEHKELMHGVRILYMEWGWGWSAYISLTVSAQFWIYTLMLCILVYPSIFTSTSGDSCMLSETTYVSLVNFPSIQIVFLSVSLVTDQGFRARLASECSVDAQFFFKKINTWLLNHWPWELRWFKVKSPKVILTHIVSWLKLVWVFKARKLFKYNFNWVTWP